MPIVARRCVLHEQSSSINDGLNPKWLQASIGERFELDRKD